MKIGILTYFWAENPGTFLQAYSTYNAVKGVCPTHEVEMINVRLRKVNFKIAKSYLFAPRVLIKAYGRYISYERGYKNVKFSQGQYTGKDTKKALEYIKEQNYNIIFVGSDTVYQLYDDWNNEMLSVYYLEGIDAKKIMLAASCGSASISNFSSNMKNTAFRCLNEFYKLGVRDKNTFDLFAELKGDSNNIEIIPDPTFSYEIDAEKARKVLKKYNFNFEGHSVLLNLPNSFKHLPKIVSYFKDIGWKIITFHNASYSDYCLFIEPAEWAGIPRFVSMVITDRFHGSVFSIKNNTPVISVDCDPIRLSASNSSKNKCLFDEYGLNEFYINCFENPTLEYFLNVINKARKLCTDFADVNSFKKSVYLNYIKRCINN